MNRLTTGALWGCAGAGRVSLAALVGLSVPFCLAGTLQSAGAQPPGHSQHDFRRGEKLYLRCQIDSREEPYIVEAALELPSLTTEARLEQVVDLPAPLAAVRVTRYLPRAACEQHFAPDDSKGTSPGIELSVDGPGQSYRQWLVGDNPERNRLISLIGTWRYMAVADEDERNELFGQFENELIGQPTLLISGLAGQSSHELPAKPGVVRNFDDLGCKIRVREFFPHFGMDHQTNKRSTLSNKRVNPAALVEIEHEGAQEERWVFSRFPGFHAAEPEELPFRVSLDCPLEPQSNVPDFALVTIGRVSHELWRHEGKESLSKQITLNERIGVPGSQYTFHIAQFVPQGRLIERYRAIDKRPAVAALQIETTDASGDRLVIWLEKGKERVVSTAAGPMTVLFGPRHADAPKGHK